MTSSPVLDRNHVRTKGIIHVPSWVWTSNLCNVRVSQDKSFIVSPWVVFILEKKKLYKYYVGHPS